MAKENIVGYTIVYFIPNTDKYLFFQKETDISKLLYSSDINIMVSFTSSLSDCILFNSFDDAKTAIYNMKYHHRELCHIKTGVLPIKESQLLAGSREIVNVPLSKLIPLK